MDHSIQKIYQENRNSWAVVCTCGWKEKGISQAVAYARFDIHRKQPVRPPIIR